MNLYLALKYLHPTADFDFDIIVQDDSNGSGPYIKEWRLDLPRPSEDDISFAMEQIRLQEYKGKRAAEYPPIADYLDGFVKGDQAQIDRYIAACLAVKSKYPKS